MFIAALFTIARTLKQPRCPLTDERIRCGIYTQWNITHCNIKNTSESILMKWMKLEPILQSEVSHQYSILMQIYGI